MADFEFLKVFEPGSATLIVLLPDCTVSRIPNLNPAIINIKCPLLGYAFDDGPNGDLQATIEATSPAVVAAFLRYIYTDDYPPPQEDDGPFSLLIHAEIYKLALNYDVPMLQVLAQSCFFRETELSCSVPYPPIDLCAAIRFIYEDRDCFQSFIDTLVNYCVTCFKYHGLGSNSEFRRVAFETPEFHKGLFQTNLGRDFVDDGAFDILGLPVCRSNPRSVDSTHNEKRTHSQFEFPESYDSPGTESKTEELQTKRRRPSADHKPTFRLHFGEVIRTDDFPGRDLGNSGGTFTAVHRPKIDNGPPPHRDSPPRVRFSGVSEIYGYSGGEKKAGANSITAVHRPKTNYAPMPARQDLQPPMPLPAIKELQADLDDMISSYSKRSLPPIPPALSGYLSQLTKQATIAGTSSSATIAGTSTSAISHALDKAINNTADTTVGTTISAPSKESDDDDFEVIVKSSWDWADDVDDAREDATLSPANGQVAKSEIGARSTTASPSFSEDWEHLHSESVKQSPTAMAKAETLSDDDSDWSLLQG